MSAYPFHSLDGGNLEAVDVAAGINLVSAEREKSVGTFSVDLVAEEAGGAIIVIENQPTRVSGFLTL